MSVDLDNVSEEQIEFIMVNGVCCFGDSMKGRTIRFNEDSSVSVYGNGETVAKTYASLVAYLDYAAQEDDSAVKH